MYQNGISKSAIGHAKYTNGSARASSRSASNDSTSTDSPSPLTTTGLKLVLKRQSGDKYEVKANPNSVETSTNSSYLSSSLNETSFSNISKDPLSLSFGSDRPRRVAARKVKFVFNENEYDLGNELSLSRAKRARYVPPVSPSSNTTTLFKPKLSPKREEESSLEAFEPSEIIAEKEAEKQRIIENQPQVIINHSKPFPIALVEDKTNVVYTKALLFLHLFKSYLSQCIHCPWCNTLLNVSEFSKHLHADNLDSDDEEEEISESESDSELDVDNEEYIKLDEADKQFYAAKKKKERKLRRLLKKSFKILPYCISGNEELSEMDVKRWHLFGEKFAKYKQSHQSRLGLQQSQRKQKESKTTDELKSDEASKNFTDWDMISAKDGLFVMNKQRLVADNVVLLNNSGDELELDATENTEQSLIETQKRKLRYDFSLSEDEDEPDAERKQAKKLKTQRSLTDEAEKKFVYPRPPTMSEKYINLYDSMPKATLLYIMDNQFTIVPSSFLSYYNRKRLIKMNKLKLARTGQYKIMWLCMCLDLECSRQ